MIKVLFPFLDFDGVIVKYLLFKLCFGDQDLLSVDNLPVALQTSTIFINDLGDQQTVVLGHAQQELVVVRNHHLGTVVHK